MNCGTTLSSCLLPGSSRLLIDAAEAVEQLKARLPVFRLDILLESEAGAT